MRHDLSLPSSIPSPPAGDRCAAGPVLQEIFARPGDGGATGFLLALAGSRRDAPLFWVQERKAIAELGRPYLPGLPAGLVHVAAGNAREALWAMEEGLKCPGLAAVIGEIHGDPGVLDFTATRRLAVAAERYGVPAYLIRIAGHADLSGARERWRVESWPSRAHPHDPRAPGCAVWRAELFRSRTRPAAVWEAAHDRAADRLDLAPASGDGALAQGA
jgi:protein ImuA